VLITSPARMRRPAAPVKQPRVSVVIPVHNYGHFLRECVSSILTQEGVEVDVLIIDDGSSDDSLSIAKAIAQGEDRVRVIANGRNLGMVPTMNKGLWQVDGEYVVKFDADDVLTPGALARATALLEAHPSVGFVYGFPVTFTQSPPPPARTKVRSWTVWSGHDWIRIRCAKGANCIYQPEVVMRTGVLHEAGKYKAELGHAPDFEMWLRLATIADVGRVNGPHQGYYRIHENSWQRTMNDFYLNDFERHRQIFAGLFQESASKFPDAPQLSRMARRALAINAIERASRAYDEGHAQEEPIDGYVALALDVYPEAPELHQWRSLHRRRTTDPQRAARLPVARVKRLQRDVEDRLSWRRWRWSGV
jgi:glycosyltransferase involved in cell wall biosynthesis